MTDTTHTQSSAAKKHAADSNGTDTRNQRRVVEGLVSSDKMQKTITVVVERTYKHPKYKKYVRKAAKYHAHDEEGLAKRGDRVEIAACRPLSRLKRWRLVRVIEKAQAAAAIEFSAAVDLEGGAT